MTKEAAERKKEREELRKKKAEELEKLKEKKAAELKALMKTREERLKKTLESSGMLEDVAENYGSLVERNDEVRLKEAYMCLQRA